MDLLLDCLKDTFIDSVKLLPFLLITYIIMEALEHSSGSKAKTWISKAGKSGPLLGGLLGIVPQCGFSAGAASLYAGRVISVGTVLAVFLSTSDEMLPILISQSVAIPTILKILGTKALFAIVSGFIVDLIYHLILKKKDPDVDIETVCEEEHCSCEDGVFVAALKHTLKIFLYIFIISLILNLLIGILGEESLAAVLSAVPILGEAVAALIGLIPNCASSVVITQLYISGVISAGAMMAGLLVNAGVGLLVLFRLNRHLKENLAIIGILYAFGVFWGTLIELLRIVF